MMYYTYTHATPDGVVFYIGKGKKSRAYSQSDRTIAWREKVRENAGINIKIIKCFETEKEAYDHEMQLIKEYKDLGFDLLNATDGGKGPNGAYMSEETKEKIRLKNKGRVFEKIECPHCGFVGGKTSTKSWHFDKCRGYGGKSAVARVTIDGKRIYMGRFPSKEEAVIVEDAYYLAKGLIRNGTRVTQRPNVFKEH